MQRTTSVTVGLLFVAALAAVAVLGLRPKREPEPTPAAKSSASAATTASAVPSSSAMPGASPADVNAAAAPGEPLVTEGFENFPDGGKVPELPASAPARV